MGHVGHVGHAGITWSRLGHACHAVLAVWGSGALASSRAESNAIPIEGCEMRAWTRTPIQKWLFSGMDLVLLGGIVCGGAGRDGE